MTRGVSRSGSRLSMQRLSGKGGCCHPGNDLAWPPHLNSEGHEGDSPENPETGKEEEVEWSWPAFSHASRAASAEVQFQLV